MQEEDRVIFLKGKQREFIEDIKNKSGLNWKELAFTSNFKYHRLRYDLKNEIYSLSYKDYKRLCAIVKVQPLVYHKNIKEFRNKNWGQKLAGFITGNKNRGKIKRKIKYPRLNKKLAEFIGILLGDGSISRSKYCIEIILNKNVDKCYSGYVMTLYKELFGLVPTIKERNNTIIIQVYSLALFNFLKYLDLPHGATEKYIPQNILSDKDLKYACLRGLFDTDGSVHLSSRWCVLNFTSSSKHLYRSFFDSLEEMGLKAIRSGSKINITSLWKIKKFFNLIGSSNLKNIIKYIEYTKNHNSVKNYDAIKLCRFYQKTKLPFRGL